MSPKYIPFGQVLTDLLDNNKPFPPIHLHQFSDLDGENFRNLKSIWSKVDPQRKALLLEDLENLAEADTLVCFDNLAKYALEDEVPNVRQAAINLLWESEDPKLIRRFIQILKNDQNLEVVAAAASALGRFIYLGELDEIQSEKKSEVEDSLLNHAINSESKLVRLRALESLGFSSRDEVPQLIKTAYSTNEQGWLASSLIAMGRSADIRWEKDVLKMLDHPNAVVQEEAIRAAGSLELKSARRPLLILLKDAWELDSGVFTAVVWSLSQIGGESVREALEALLDGTDDEDEIEYIESAIENLDFTDSFPIMDLLDVEIPTKDDLGQVIDLLENEKKQDTDEDLA